MIKTILLVLVLFTSVLAQAQHDMKNMQDTKMLSHPSSEKSAAKDTIPAAMHDMQMQKESHTTHSSLQQSFEKVNLSPGKTVRYDLYVRDTIVNYTGKNKHAIAVNGSIPMPTLYFTEGDTAEIYLHNELSTE
ncbi:MAG: multicopper oxidase domain-containing protein, partial [Flavisolibacter sp.]